MPKKRVDKFWWKEDDLVYDEEKSLNPEDISNPKSKKKGDDIERIKEKLGVTQDK